jgi:DNA-binding CsgD family transcriptional regulator
MHDRYRFEVKGLVFCFIIISICEVFFLIDIAADIFSIDITTDWLDHSTVELFSTITLAFAMIGIGLQLMRLLKEHQQAKDSVDIASGGFLRVVHHHFMLWKLSPSERDVALLLIKGMSTQEIADIRDTKAGTVKSQTSSIYQKAGVKGRNELAAYFVEDLLAGDVFLGGNSSKSGT